VSLTCQDGNHSKVVAKLQDLIALFSKAQIAKMKNKVAQTLEQGLLLSNSLNLTYMKDGATWVATLHLSICAQFLNNL
jgi:hypothetical protein